MPTTNQPTEASVMLRLTLEEAKLLQQFRAGELPLSNQPFTNEADEQALEYLCYANAVDQLGTMAHLGGAIISYLGDEEVNGLPEFKDIVHQLKTLYVRLGETQVYCEGRFDHI